MKIKWSDYVSNVEVLRRVGLNSIEAVLATMQLRSTGNVISMADDRIPMQLLCGEQEPGKRKIGGQKLRLKDVVKRHLKAAEIDTTNLEDLTGNRANWRRTLLEGREKIQSNYVEASELRHYRRHNLRNYSCHIC